MRFEREKYGSWLSEAPWPGRARLVPLILSLVFVAGMILSKVEVDHFSNSFTTDQHKQKEITIAGTDAEQHLEHPIKETCLDPSGPQPYILMSLGRSGSGSTWQVIGSLSGMETPSHEYTGSNTKGSIEFFKEKGDDDKWLLKYLCRKQRKYPNAGVVGFKWKPYEPIFNAPAAQAGLNTIATLKEPTIKVVRMRRNLLDVQISRRKHSDYHTKAHCMKGDTKCVKDGLVTGIHLYTGKMDELYKRLKFLHEHEERVDKLLTEMNIPHVQVTYDRLYNVDGKGGDIEEWEKIFSFLGVGPASNLTHKQLELGMKHAATHPPGHNLTLANYDEVAEALKGTKFENLLHRRHRRV